MGEFELIERYFKRATYPSHVALGVGDDCALLQPAPGMQLAISSDMLVEGRHFLPDVDPQALGHKALAVNLSDLAACGARPLAFTLALALPQAHAPWLAGFAQGLLDLAEAHGCALIGGDTTQGPLNICITIFGEVPAPGGATQALQRSGAQAGDALYVSGQPGQARLALDALLGQRPLPAAVLAALRPRLERPTPRVALGLALRGVASAAMDVSDGLQGDLRHILKASGVGATLDVDAAVTLLGSNTANAVTDWLPTLPREAQLRCVLAGGDDYELLFTAPPSRHAQVLAAAQASGTPVACIGRIDREAGLRLVDAHGQAIRGDFPAFDHFAA